MGKKKKDKTKKADKPRKVKKKCCKKHLKEGKTYCKSCPVRAKIEGWLPADYQGEG
ncbi:MAG: hypothetical protein WBA17_14030 [Saprospiraceae bacterium]